MQPIPEIQSPVLVVDDDEGLLLSIKTILVRSGMPAPALVSDGRRVMELLRENRFYLVLLDLIMPNINGLEILKDIKTNFPATECVIISAIDDISAAVQAMKYGAYDYLVKPLDKEKLIIAINHALERYSLRQGLALYESKQSFSDLKNPHAFKEMVAEDKAMARVFHLVETIAPTEYSVVITGESGTGKEMVARFIHNLSKRSNGPFVPVNVAAISGTLFEDEFFGHDQGAFTGALSVKRGFFEEAEGGTLFLDEIADLELALQVKLLRVLQERELYRLGSTKIRNVNVRIVAATNRDINEEIRKGHFRADLFHRLNMSHIKIPPLRERKKDILALARHFLEIHASNTQKKIKSLTPDLVERLLQLPFPGNVRELENIIASAVLLEKDEMLTLSATLNLTPVTGSDRQRDETMLSLAEMEKRHIHRALEVTAGNRTHAAQILGIGLRTLQRKLKSFDGAITTPK